MPINLLFVCSRNQWRSPTAEKIYANDPRVNVRSAGTSRAARRSITLKDVRWADKIVVMEHKHKQRIQATFRQDTDHKDICVLDIPDEYTFMDDALIELLRDTIEPLLEQLP